MQLFLAAKNNKDFLKVLDQNTNEVIVTGPLL
jgi:hypothetical protein